VAGAGVVALPPRGRSVEGEVSVIDGDSLRIGDLELRLKGIDAPEMRQTCHRGGRPYRCGETARQALRAKVAGRALACRIDGRDRYGRALARWRIDGQDLGGWLVR
jgi:endonuclease YncB( thermonuclease family)